MRLKNIPESNLRRLLQKFLDEYREKVKRDHELEEK
jgi:hypothetical protein